MATEEEERRRRREEQAALTGLTPEYIDMLERQLARQRGEETPEGAGADYYTPPLTKYAPISGDSRSERTGLMRPVGNILDRLVRPGWQASMNRQQRDLTGQRQAYAEQRPTQAAQQSALLTDSQLEALKQKASDPNATPEERAAATKYLSSYVQALSTRAGGGAVPPWSTIAQKGGEAGRDAGGSARPRAGGPNAVTTPLVTTPPVTTPSGPTTPSDVARQVLRDDFQHGATLALFPEEAIQQATSKLKARKVNEQQTLAMAEGEDQPSPQTLKYIQKARARIEDIDTKLSTISGSTAGAGGATQTGAAITQ
jgi:hypothetical protein